MEGDPDLRKALELGMKYASDRIENIMEHRVVKVENLYFQDPRIWIITFKLKELIPHDPHSECIGAGGDIFVKIHLGTRECEIRYDD